MIPNHHSAEGIELGNQIAGMALAKCQALGVLHDLAAGLLSGHRRAELDGRLRQRTANHFADHVLYCDPQGGGYPTGERDLSDR